MGRIRVVWEGAQPDLGRGQMRENGVLGCVDTRFEIAHFNLDSLLLTKQIEFTSYRNSF